MVERKTNTTLVFDLKGKTVLIADDEFSVRFYYQEVFSDSGANVIFAKNGFEVVELYKIHPEIDIVLMDFRMPLQSGLMASMEIFKINPNALIVIQSASDSPKDKEECLEIGCLDFLLKPIHPDILIEVIQKNKQNS